MQPNLRLLLAMRTVRKRSLTLLELSVVLLLLAVSSGAFLWSLQGMIAHHRFTTSAHRLCRELLFLQSRALSQGVTFQITCSKDEFTIETDEPSLPKKEVIAFSGIETIRFDGKEPFPLLLYPSGRIVPSPLIKMTSPKGKTLSLDLRYPLAVSLSSKLEEKRVPLPVNPQKKEK